MSVRLLLSFVLVAVFAGTAAADKPKLAVLGLEIAGSIDTESTSHGRLLTDMFRTKVSSGTRFTLAPNSTKADLLDEKVAAGCDSDTADCMGKIALKFKADILVYGKIEKRPKDGKDGYQLSMKSFDVAKKSSKEWGEWVPYSDFVEGGLDARVVRGFDALVGKDANEPVVTPNPTPTPTPNPPPPKKGGGGFPWKTTAYVSTGLTMVALGGAIFYGLKVNDLEKNCHPGEGLDPDLATSFDMGGGTHTGGFSANDCRQSKGDGLAKKSTYAGVAAGALGAFALFAYYEGFIAKKSSKESSTQTSGRQRKKKQFAVTPILSPDGAGATVRLDW